MSHPYQSPKQRAITLLVTLCTLLASFAPAAVVQAAPLGEPTATTVELFATQDARIQAGSPDNGFGSGFIWVGTPDGHLALVQFDLLGLPVNATINSAELQLNFTGVYTPTANVELGRNESAWDENTVTWNTKPIVSFGGPVQPVGNTPGVISWNVTPLVTQWHNDPASNYGFALRGDGPLKSFYSTETDVNKVPKLVITYSEPASEGARPDLGDAPDSTNHHGINNTAYPSGILGQFPTVRDVPVGQPAGPRHDNQTMEGWLGNFLSREAEADQGPDQDGPNNILRNAAGAVGDMADLDRGDDGWRNRNLRFFDCERTQLEVRISKAATATLNRMYLNVWFDGNRDGDWSDLGQCQADEDQPAQASYEWIVQNYIIDMTAIPAGGSLDFNVLTEKVLNSSGIGRHWMRFTLSEELAVQPISGDLPDGRGPHPSNPVLSSFKYGETEDVLQKSAPPGEDGELVLEKRVITNAEPTEWIDYVTYEIRLRHNGGSQPLLARMHDVLPYPLVVYPTIDAGGVHYVSVDSPTGGAAPLQAQLDVIPPNGGNPPQQVVKWQGALAPNAEIKFTFQVRVLALCQPNQQTLIITNTAQAQPRGGAAIAASDTFTAKCIGYTADNVEINANPITTTIDLDDITHVPWRGTIHNLHPVSVTLGIYQKPLTGTVEAAAADLDKSSPLLMHIMLGPNETKSLVQRWSLDLPVAKPTNELDLPDDYTIDLKLGYCILPPGLDTCPDEAQFPNLHGHIPYTLAVRPNDLGDAPDSTNHAGANMAAYPAAGVQANFPTVFDPAAGLPQGPRHSYPRPFHLGQRVSREAEADIGPDQDPLNNIVPAANDPDNDRGDDGTNFALWNLNNCQTANLPVRVAIAPQAVNYFQQLGTPGYLNIWIDSNRDGDWADAAQCGEQPAVEHIVIDHPVNVTALGAGLHTINTPTGLVPWLVTDKPAWVRITLSERPSNKTLAAGGLNYGDGRGYAIPFKTGETEDYVYWPAGAGGGPDVAVYLSGVTKQDASQQLGLQAAALDKLGNFEIQMFKIDYENLGTAPAQNALLEFQIPEKLRGMELVLAKSTNFATEDMFDDVYFDKISLILPHIEQNARDSLVLGWYGCLTCTVTAANADVDYSASVNITLDGDIDPTNNQSSTTVRGLLSSPIIGAFMDYTDDSCMDHIVSGLAVTNRTSINLRGKAEPNQIIAILIGLVKVAEVTSDANGDFAYNVTLGEGLHEISAHNIVSPRDPQSGLPTSRLRLLVNPALPYDPMSACFVDSNARSYAMPTLGYSFGATQTGSWLRSGETYTVSLNASSGNLNQYFKVILEDVVVSRLKDEDGDGTYQGLVVMPDPGVVQAAGTDAPVKLGLIVGNGSTESRFSTEVALGADGVISDRSTGQPLANASVAALVAQATEDGSVVYSAWTESQSGQTNPQVTGADGKYSYSASAGLYRIDVVRDGYQPYRSGDIDAGEELLNMNIALSPVINEAATQTIYITENGYTPASATVTSGSVVEFVNLDLDDHSATGSTWDSGVLTTGQSYKVKLTAEGSFDYGDSTGSLAAGTIIVDDSSVTPAANAVYLPLVQR